MTASDELLLLLLPLLPPLLVAQAARKMRELV
jgi:hypothetical protein